MEINQGIKNITFINLLFCYLLFFIFYSLGYILAFDSAYFVILSVLMFFGIICFIFYQNLFLFIFLFPFLLSQITLIISVAYLDFGAFSPEIKEFTSAGQSVVRLIALDIYFFFCTSTIVLLVSKFNLFKRVLNNQSRDINGFFTIKVIVYLVILFLIIYGLIFRFPLFELEQRFDYWSVAPFGNLISKILYITSSLGLYFGYFFVKLPHKRLEIILMVILLGLLAILYSNKFSWFFGLLTFYILGAGFSYCCLSESKKFRSWFFKILIKFLLIVSPIVVFGYVFLHGYVGDDLIYILENRVLTMQGQVWWFVDYYVQNDQINSEISDVFLKYPAEQPSGIFKMMELIMPEQAFLYYFEKKIPLTMGFPAILIFSGGYLGALVLMPLFALIYSYIYFYTFLSLLKLSFFRIGVVTFMLSALPWALSLGSTYVIFTPLFIIVILASLIDVFLLLKRPNEKYMV